MTRGSFVRWQKIAIDQLGYAVNLVLTFAVAALGYWFVLLRDKDFAPGASARCMLLLSFMALAGSAIAGLVCILNRLRDFRGTARRARSESDGEKPAKEYLDGLGRVTWVLFYFQAVSFAVGIVFLAVALLLTDGGKLV